MDGRNIGQAEIYVDLCKGEEKRCWRQTPPFLLCYVLYVHKGDGLVFKKEKKKKLKCGELSKIGKPSYKLLP